MKRGIKYDFTLIALLLIPIGVAINFIGGQIVNLLKLPVYLDTIGTALVAMIAGPWVGMFTGACTNLVKSITNPVSLAFAPVSMLVGLVVGYLSTKGMFSTFGKVLVAGVVVTFASALATAPIQVLLFGGAAGHSSLIAVFLASGQKIWTAVFSATIINESIDKILCLLAGYLIVQKMSPRYLSKLNYGDVYLKNRQRNER